MPNLVAQYNRFMGGTDRMDQNIAKFRSRSGGGHYSVSESMSACRIWQLYRMSEAAKHRYLTTAQFRCDVALTYITKYHATISSIGCSIRSRAVACCAFLDGVLCRVKLLVHCSNVILWLINHLLQAWQQHFQSVALQHHPLVTLHRSHWQWSETMFALWNEGPEEVQQMWSRPS